MAQGLLSAWGKGRTAQLTGQTEDVSNMSERIANRKRAKNELVRGEVFCTSAAVKESTVLPQLGNTLT